MAITVALCGQIRRPDLFADQLRRLARLRADGLVDAVYFSTWAGEVERYPQLYPALEAAAVTLIEAPEPKKGYAGPGHFYLQSATLKRVLQRLPPDCIVLRMRPDITFPQRVRLDAVVRHIETQVSAPCSPLGGLVSRIFIGTLSLTHPFWIEDRYFAGRAQDLARLAHSDIDYDHFAHPSAAIAEVRWFSRPFVDLYHAAHESLRINWLLECDRTPGGRGEGFRTLLSHNGDLQRLLAIYHHILERNFIIGLPAELLAAEPPHELLEPAPAPPDFLRQFANRPEAGPVYRRALQAVRADPDQLAVGLIDETALALDLLQLGCALHPKDVARAPEAYARPAPPVLRPTLAWGAAPYGNRLPSGAPLYVAVAWRGASLGVGPAIADLVARWQGSSDAEQTLRLEGLNGPSAERHLALAPPAAPGPYQMQLALRGPDGKAIGQVVEHKVVIHA